MILHTIFRRGFHFLNRQKNQEGSFSTIINMDYVVNPFQSSSGLKNAKKVFEKIEEEKVIFHCYWFGPFGRMQAASITSLVTTQVSYKYEIWLWLDEATKACNIDSKWIKELPRTVIIKYYNPNIVKSVPDFRKVFYLFNDMHHLPYRADGFRLWALHEFGGFYFDLDIMFFKDMGQLIRGPEFVYAWEKQRYANNAIIYLRKNSWLNKYIARKVRKTHSTQPWIIFNYDDKNLKGLKLLSASTFDPIWNDDDPKYIIHNFSEFFIKPVSLDSFEEVFPFSYGYHWHNNWDVEINEMSLFAILEKKNLEILRNEGIIKDDCE